ncbi:glycosyltransferase, partial [Bacteroides uniformis]
MLISIIIPIYNVEKYLNRCLDSVMKQSFQDIEIILVNDGSTDNSDNIIKSYLFDERIKYIY